MKIHFCDLCNESVPQSDIDEGRAFMRKGHVVCLSCDRAMSHVSASSPAPARTEGSRDPLVEPVPMAAAPAAQAPASVGSAGLWFAIVAMLFTAAAIAILNHSLEKLAGENQRQEQVLNETRQSIQALVDRVGAAERQRGEQVEREHAASASLQTALDSVRSQAREDAAARATEVAAQSQSIADLRAELVAWQEDSDRRLVSHSERLGRSDDELSLLVERFSALEAGPTMPAEPADAAGASSASVAQWSVLLVDLTSPNAGIRWQAVVGLGDTKDPAVVPSLLPMLADKDVFVRMACARVLGDLGHNSAVPALIDSLEDGEAPVREAASIALRAITGKDLRFDPLGNEADRAKKVKAWREWWKKLQEEPGSSPG